MRKITVDTEKGTAEIRTIDIKLPDLGMTFAEYAKKGFLGRKLNGLSYSRVARFSKKYHDLSKAEIEAVKDKKFVNLVLELIANE